MPGRGSSKLYKGCLTRHTPNIPACLHRAQGARSAPRSPACVERKAHTAAERRKGLSGQVVAERLEALDVHGTAERDADLRGGGGGAGLD